MLLGFLGCLGAIYEVRCLLGLVSLAGAADDDHDGEGLQM